MQPTSRKCGECTACCDGWLASSIHGHAMYPGCACFFKGAHGCTIYDKRPENPCRGFNCGYIQAGSPFPEWFKPSSSGVIVIPQAWGDSIYYALIETDKGLSLEVLLWILDYAETSKTPFAYMHRNKWRFVGSSEFVAAMTARVAQHGTPMQ